MIDLTPLDVRNKRGDFKKLMRGYDPQEVDVFLELVAERLEALVRENIQLRERTQTLQQQVSSQLGREQAVQDALVTAQELRADIKAQSQREAEHVLKAAEAEARRLLAEAEAEARGKVRDGERRMDGAKDTLVELERRRTRFLKEFRQLLERELDVVDVEEGRVPLEERTIDLELGSARGTPRAEAKARGTAGAAPEPSPEAEEGGGGVGLPGRAGASPEGPNTTAQAPGSAEALPGAEGTTGSPPRGTGGGGAPPQKKPRGKRSGGTDAAGPTNATAPAADVGDDAFAASFEAEAVAEAQSRVVEVRGTDADGLASVPRLEEVLAEAGAELADASPQDVTARSRDVQEIAPPPARGRGEETLLLYLDAEEKDG